MAVSRPAMCLTAPTCSRYSFVARFILSFISCDCTAGFVPGTRNLLYSCQLPLYAFCKQEQTNRTASCDASPRLCQPFAACVLSSPAPHACLNILLDHTWSPTASAAVILLLFVGVNGENTCPVPAVSDPTRMLGCGPYPTKR